MVEHKTKRALLKQIKIVGYRKKQFRKPQYPVEMSAIRREQTGGEFYFKIMYFNTIKPKQWKRVEIL